MTALLSWFADSTLTPTEAISALRDCAATWRELARTTGDADQAREAGRYVARAEMLAALADCGKCCAI